MSYGTRPSDFGKGTPSRQGPGGDAEGLKSITAPTLFVTGADDVIAPARNAKLMAAVVPGAELVEVPGAGHGLMYQEPQKLADVVMDFLDQ